MRLLLRAVIIRLTFFRLLVVPPKLLFIVHVILLGDDGIGGH